MANKEEISAWVDILGPDGVKELKTAVKDSKFVEVIRKSSFPGMPPISIAVGDIDELLPIGSMEELRDLCAVLESK